MKSFTVCLFASLAALACAEPPSGYNYPRPSGGHGGGGGGFSGASFGSGFSAGGGGGGGGSLQQVDFGSNTNEGQSVDPQILEAVRQIILRSEASGGSGGLTSSYGVPALKVVDVTLDGIRQAIQVAQYQQTHQGAPIAIPAAPGYNRGPATSYSAPSFQANSFSGSSSSFSAPSNSYGAPSGPSFSSPPSNSYGAPFSG